MKATALLNLRDLNAWLQDVLPRLGFASSRGRISPQAGDGLDFDVSSRATPAPLDAITVARNSNGRPTRLRFQPGVLIGGCGFAVPTVNGRSICDDNPPEFATTADYLFFKITLLPDVVQVDVTESDLRGGIDPPASSTSIHYVTGVRITSVEIVDGATLDHYDPDSGGTFTGWNSTDGNVVTTYYSAFAQFYAPDSALPNAGDYIRFGNGGQPILNYRPETDLIVTGVETPNTEALYS